MASETIRHSSMEPSHPGEMLGEIVIPATGKSKAEIARLSASRARPSTTSFRGKQGALTPARSRCARQALRQRSGNLASDAAGP